MQLSGQWLKCETGGAQTLWFGGRVTRLGALLQDQDPWTLLQHSMNAQIKKEDDYFNCGSVW